MSGFSVQKNKVIDTNCCICYDVQDAAFFAEFANLRLRIPKGAGMLWTVFFLEKAGFGFRDKDGFFAPRPFCRISERRIHLQNQEPAVRKLDLIWRFLKGSKIYFVLSMLTAALTAFADMISPQIIRAAVDNAIGGNEPTFGPAVMKVVDAVGGFAYLGKHLWIMALAILAVAVVKVLSQYGFMLSNTRASETLVKTMRDTLYTHIERLPFSWHMKNHTGDIIQPNLKTER